MQYLRLEMGRMKGKMREICCLKFPSGHSDTDIALTSSSTAVFRHFMLQIRQYFLNIQCSAQLWLYLFDFCLVLPVSPPPKRCNCVFTPVVKADSLQRIHSSVTWTLSTDVPAEVFYWVYLCHKGFTHHLTQVMMWHELPLTANLFIFEWVCYHSGTHRVTTNIVLYVSQLCCLWRYNPSLQSIKACVPGLGED